MSDLHKGLTKYNYEKTLLNGLNSQLITRSDHNLITEYIRERKITHQLSIARVNKLTTHLVLWRRFLKAEYKDAHISDIYEAVETLQKGNSNKGKPFKQNTIHDYIRALKPFLQWMIENEYSELQEKKVKRIKSPAVDCDTTRPDEILTQEDVLSLITHAQNTRDKALIAVLYESGCRIGELSRLFWRDAIFDEYGVKLYIKDEKTKKERYSRLTFSTDYLANWLNNSPLKKPNDRIFITFRTQQPLEYRGYIRALDRAKKYSGLKKKVTPHLFRKSRITHMITSNYQESVIKKTMWGNINTQMFQTYVRLSENDIDNELLDKAGIIKKSDQPNPLLPKTCGDCHHINSPDAIFCVKCGSPLTVDAEQLTNDKIIQAMNYIETKPGFKEFYEEYRTFLNAKMEYQKQED